MEPNKISTRLLSVLLKGLLITILCLLPVFFYACSGSNSGKEAAPEWTKKTYWKDRHNFFAVGVHSGHFVNEQDAYFSALRELNHFLDSSLSGSGASGLERTGVVKCRSAKKEYAAEDKGPSDQSTSEPVPQVEASEEFYSEYSESEAGVYARYLLSATGGGYNMELGYDCSAKNINKTLRTIPLIDSYFVKKGETVTTYVLIKYDETLLKPGINQPAASKPE